MSCFSIRLTKTLAPRFWGFVLCVCFLLLSSVVASAQLTIRSSKSASKESPAAASSSNGSQTGASSLSPASGEDSGRVNIGIVYPVSSNGMQAKSLTNKFSLNALIGLSAGETGFSMAGLSNIIFGSASGVQIAGLSNHIFNTADGTQMAGLMNYTGGMSKGVQLAGLLNVNGSNSGVNVAGFANISKRNSTGVQVAGFLNNASNAQVQVAGFMNRSANVQSQVGGFLNIAKKVKGVQVGFINIADSCDYTVGILNFVKNGEKSIGISTDETLTNLVTFRSGGKYLYGIAGVGFNDKGRRTLAAWEAGLGYHLLNGAAFRMNLESVSSGLTDFKHGDCTKHSLRVLPAYRIFSHVEIYAGPTINYFYSKKGQGVDVTPHYLWSDINGSTVKGIFFGVTGGIQVRI